MSESEGMNERIALVTGANKGIGLEVSRGLAKAGFTVLMASRDAARGEAAAKELSAEGLSVFPVVLDLAKSESFAAVADLIGSKYGHLDVLVNNAAIVDPFDGSPGEADVKAVRRVFDTNFFGTVEVTQAMLPLIKKSRAGRIVNLSSGLGSLTLNADPASGFREWRLLGYNGSKAALNMFTIQLATELKEHGILVNAANPGYTATDMNGNRGTQTVEQGAQEAIRLALLPDGGPTGGFTEIAGPLPW